MPLGLELGFHEIALGNCFTDSRVASFGPLKTLRIIMCLHMASADRLNDDGHYPDQHFVVRTFRNRGVELDVQLRRCRAVDLAAVHFRHQQLEVPDVLGCGPLAGQACDLRFNQHTRLKQILDQLLLIGEMQSQGVFPNARSRAHKGSAPLPDYNHILRSQELHG